ncbi:MAG: DUF2061 domain-containing protein [Gammaproteobacteria bacterium]
MAAVKTCSFAVVHMCVAFAVAWALTGDWRIGGALALVEPAVNTFAYYLHERGWTWWGRRLLEHFRSPVAHATRRA